MVATGEHKTLEIFFHKTHLFVFDCRIERITSGILVFETSEVIFNKKKVNKPATYNIMKTASKIKKKDFIKISTDRKHQI